MHKSFIPEVSRSLQQYVAENILPRYDGYDKAHSRRHIQSVIEQSMEIFRKLSAGQMDGGRRYDLNPDMIYAIAAYHDVGICEGRESHHLVSGRMLEADTALCRWFSPEQIHVMREAVEDHRSSNKSWPRSIYGRIVSEADKVIDFDTVFSRAILYARASCPEMTDEEIFRKSYGHLLGLSFRTMPVCFCSARFLRLTQDGRWSSSTRIFRTTCGMGLLFYGDKEHFVVPGQKRFDYARVVDFCRREGIALYDAAYMVKRLRGNASDNFLKIIEPTDIQSLLSSMPSCSAVVSTGGKSAEQIASVLDVPVPAVGGSVQFTLQPSQRTVTFHRMPSSSRAYPMSLDRKAAAYSSVLIL